MQNKIKAIKWYLDQRHKEEKNIFFMARREHVPTIIKYRNQFPLFLYMASWITNKHNARGLWVKEVLPYFTKGLLPFSKNHKYIMQDIGINKTTLWRSLSKLEEGGLIENLNTLAYLGGRKRAPIYSLGYNYNGNYIFYIDILSGVYDEIIAKFQK